MTKQGLDNLKAVLRKAIELRVSATLVSATLQSICLDEEGGLDQDAEEHLLSAMDLANWSLSHAGAATKEIQKAYEIEKNLAELEDKLLNKQDNDTARTN